MAEPKLDLILHRDAAQVFRLWACRGAGKGCDRNRYRTSKAPCEDCLGPLPEEMTIEQVLARLAQGDA